MYCMHPLVHSALDTFHGEVRMEAVLFLSYDTLLMAFGLDEVESVVALSSCCYFLPVLFVRFPLERNWIRSSSS